MPMIGRIAISCTFQPGIRAYNRRDRPVWLKVSTADKRPTQREHENNAESLTSPFILSTPCFALTESARRTLISMFAQKAVEGCR